MDVFDIRADSQETLLQLVTQELGADAIILDTQQEEVILPDGRYAMQWVATATRAREIARMESTLVQETRKKAAQGLLFMKPGALGAVARQEESVSIEPEKIEPEKIEQTQTRLKLVTEVAPAEEAQPLTDKPDFSSLMYAQPINLEARTQPTVEVIVGACGAGKSTTIAKLLTRAHLDGKSVAVVTLDTFRSCATELLAAYTDLIDIPCLAASDKGELTRVLLSLKDSVDMILIDTPGIGPRDEEKLQQVADMIGGLHADRVHLAIASDVADAIQIRQLKRFTALKPTHLILTRLDEASEDTSVSLKLMNLGQVSTLPLTYLTFGQCVPEDICIASQQSMTSCLMSDNAVETSVISMASAA